MGNKNMKIKYKTKGYDFFRTSEKQYTHATIFRNNSWTGQGTNVGAFFHSSEKLAQGKKKELDRSSHLEFIEIVELEII
jgi:hypothetical protein